MAMGTGGVPGPVLQLVSGAGSEGVVLEPEHADSAQAATLIASAATDHERLLRTILLGRELGLSC